MLEFLEGFWRAWNLNGVPSRGSEEGLERQGDGWAETRGWTDRAGEGGHKWKLELQEETV